MSALLGLIALYMVKKHTTNSFPMAIVLLLTGATVSGAGGIGIISQVDAQALYHDKVIDSRNGKTFELEEGINRFKNRSGVSMRVTRINTDDNFCWDLIDLTSDEVTVKPKARVESICRVGAVLSNTQSCEIGCGRDG